MKIAGYADHYLAALTWFKKDIFGEFVVMSLKTYDNFFISTCSILYANNDNNDNNIN